MDHPCGRWTCPEWHGGQCFGGGCETNPAPTPERKDDVPSAEDGESETTQEDKQCNSANS